MSAPEVKTISAASGSLWICKGKKCKHLCICKIHQTKIQSTNMSDITFASADGVALPAAKNDPPSTTIFLTLLTKEESFLMAWNTMRQNHTLQPENSTLSASSEEEHTNATFVRGPKASTETSPGNSETLSTKNSAALWSIFLLVGSERSMFPRPSDPWTKSATCGFPPY